MQRRKDHAKHGGGYGAEDHGTVEITIAVFASFLKPCVCRIRNKQNYPNLIGVPAYSLLALSNSPHP
jgi:hypothetical protein